MLTPAFSELAGKVYDAAEAAKHMVCGYNKKLAKDPCSNHVYDVPAKELEGNFYLTRFGLGRLIKHNGVRTIVPATRLDMATMQTAELHEMLAGITEATKRR